ncbi:SMI1/KNR4 family protein [Rhodopirellula halodulae]|uniref:SMI1/KNR4 family protein n=1 Tax=Rhodopirellula halodulae TaxID=2894198 RepID=UPI001E576674|nr:SMI1/KNR4 family protein [Rhodopirellula sp. JC737]MCC9658021.1 SMI1/KNR4 family protein [Rhodopirellula sp. JC737]
MLYNLIASLFSSCLLIERVRLCLIPTVSDSLGDAESPSDPDASVKSGRAVGAARTWSQQLQDRFHITLDSDLVAWFDEGLWRQQGNGEFANAVSPETLLKPAPEPVWPPLMPPNFLPLVGSHSGDWLCLRLADGDAEGSGYDICHWYHGGGDWLPWGETLAEALLFDQLLPSLPASDQRHAIPSPMEVGRSNNSGGDAWHEWMVRCLPDSASHLAANRCWESGSRDWLDPLLQSNVCGAAVRCQLVIEALGNELAKRLKPADANRMGIPWNSIMKWCFDLRTLPHDILTRLKEAGLATEDAADPGQQDWAKIETLCEQAHLVSPELAWPAELLGYCRWQRGDQATGADALRASIRCSVFTDQSVRLRTHWATSGADGLAKFGAHWLTQTSADDVGSSDSFSRNHANALPASVEIADYLACLTNREGGSVRNGVTTFLQSQSQRFAAEGNAKDAVRCLYAAGWDLGAEPMSLYAELLNQLIEATRSANWLSHETFAQMHRDCFRKRYGV